MKIEICKHGIYREVNGVLKVIRTLKLKSYKNYRPPKGWKIDSVSFFPDHVEPEVTIYLDKERTQSR